MQMDDGPLLWGLSTVDGRTMTARNLIRAGDRRMLYYLNNLNEDVKKVRCYGWMSRSTHSRHGPSVVHEPVY